MTLLLDIDALHVDIPLAAGVLRAVQEVSLHVQRGETVCLVGESGCGKSLTALAVMDLLPARSVRRAERLALEGEELQRLSGRRMADLRGRRMAMIFQEPMTSLNPCYTIGNQLQETLRRHRPVSRHAARERAVFLLEKVGITAAGSRLRQYPHQLSGGLRQRVMIAMSLMCDPALMIADEPTTALDVTIQAQILSLLSSLQAEFGMGMILITHDLGIVARIAHRVAVMYCGRVVETGSAGEIFRHPLHPYTQGLLACLPVPGKTRPGKHLGSISGMVPTPIGNIGGCMFRNRCPHAVDDCIGGSIPLREISAGRAYRCLLSPESCLAKRAAWS
ncbi:MAG: ABC transporter ATP-binding protein [Desulfobacterales bacterium]|jgi:peptide/nickel transport system ATP-binding protein|nr:ABC transporter ATP-binding protein [Desulfobacterales bacterium]